MQNRILKKKKIIKSKWCITLLILVVGCISIQICIQYNFLHRAPIYTSIHSRISQNSLKSSNIQSKFEWNITWGGANWDSGNDLIIDQNDNSYIVGQTYSFGVGSSQDIVLIKYDNAGNQLWNRTWGGLESEYGNSIILDNLNQINVIGYTGSYGKGGYDACLIKYDNLGNQLWNRTWGGINYDYGYGLDVDSANNLYFVGNTNSYGVGRSDIFLAKYDNLGNQLWNRTWGGVNYDYAYDIEIDSTGNVFVIGYTNSFGSGNYDICLIKYNNLGDQLWNITWGYSGYDYGRSIAIDNLNNIYLGGYTSSIGSGQYDMVLIKFNYLGEHMWNTTWGGSEYDWCQDLAIDSLSYILSVGTTYSFGKGNNDVFLVKYDSLGNQIWNTTWGKSTYDSGYGIAIDSFDNVFFTGSTNSIGAGGYDIMFVKLVEEPISDFLVKPVDGEMIQKFRGYSYKWSFEKGNPIYDGTVSYENFHNFLEETTENGKIMKYYRVFHEGIDIDGGSAGENVISASSGTIVYIDNLDNSKAGKWMWIWHGDVSQKNGETISDISTRYLHLDTIDQSILTQIPNPNDYQGAVDIPISKGAVIGTVGNTGCKDTVEHLHFEVRQGNIPMNFNHRNTLPLDPNDFVDYRNRSYFTSSCPVDIIITDPEGLIISKEVNQIPESAEYVETKYNYGDEESLTDYDTVIFNELKHGDYLITIIPEDTANPSDKLNLQFVDSNVSLLIADDISINNIPSNPYIVRNSETEIKFILPITIDLDPSVINVKSVGKWISVYIELPQGHNYDLEMINISSIQLTFGTFSCSVDPKSPNTIWDYDHDKIEDLMVKFNRTEINKALEVMVHNSDIKDNTIIKFTILARIGLVSFNGQKSIRISNP